MSLRSLLVHDVTIRRAASVTDGNGFTRKDWTHPSASTTSKAWVTQLSTTENRDGREAQVSQWRIYLPDSVTVTGGDRIVYGSTTFEIDGDPLHAWTPRGEHHIEAELRVVTG